MRTIIIITPANIEVEYRLAGAGSRMAAFIIDLILQMIAILLIFWVAYRSTNYFGGAVWGFVLVLIFVIHFGYFISCELAMNGQTVGKRLLGLRVIRDNGQPIEFTHALVRGLIRTSVDMLYVGLFAILFSKKHKRLGDMAAGTIVISEKYGGGIDPHGMGINSFGRDSDPFGRSDTWGLDPFGGSSAPNGLEPNAIPDPRALTLTDEERHIIEEWQRRRSSLPNNGEDIGKKLEEYFKSEV